MEKNEQLVTIVLIKNYWEGYFQSLAWLVALIACIGFAVWVDSTAMQWVMGIFWMLSVISMAVSQQKKKRFTPNDAIAEIQQYVKNEN